MLYVLRMLFVLVLCIVFMYSGMEERLCRMPVFKQINQINQIKSINHIVLETFTSQEWLENFRLSKSTFDYLCTQLTLYLQYQDTHLRKAISVKKRVAITIWTCGIICRVQNCKSSVWCWEIHCL